MYSNQQRNGNKFFEKRNATTNGDKPSTFNKAEIRDLYQHVYHRQCNEQQRTGTRHLIRVVQFQRDQAPLVGLSRQWYKSETDEWLPAKTGHVFLRPEVWSELVNNIGPVTKQIEETLFANGTGGSVRFVSNAAAQSGSVRDADVTAGYSGSITRCGSDNSGSDKDSNEGDRDAKTSKNDARHREHPNSSGDSNFGKPPSKLFKC